jgi:hypothetical protein
MLAERVRWAVLGQVPGVIDALVRTQTAQVVCPLLVASARSSADIEKSVRSVLQSEVNSTDIERITVHFLDTGGVGVEAVLKSNVVRWTVSKNGSMDSLRLLAAKLKGIINQDNEIIQTNILLAL